MSTAAAAGGTPFHDLARYVAIPRVTALRLSPDGSWLAAAVQTLAPDLKTYVTSIWRIPAGPGSADAPRRLTRSADGESNPRFLPDGSLLFISKRPGREAAGPVGPAAADRPDEAGGPGQLAGAGGEQPAAWLLPAGGGEAVPVADRPGGVSALETAERAGAIVIASAVMPAAGAGTDATRTVTTHDGARHARTPGSRPSCTSRSRSGTGITTWARPSSACSPWAGPASRAVPPIRTAPVRTAAGTVVTDPDGPGPDAAGIAAGQDGPAELRDLTPAPGRALDEQSFCVSADGSTAAAGWWRWESHGESHAELAVIDMASAARRTLLSAPGFDYEHPAISPDGRYVACIRSAHHAPEAPGDVTIVLAPLCWPGGATPLEPPAARFAPRRRCSPTHRRSPGLKARTRWPVTIASP